MRNSALWGLCVAIIFHALYTNKPLFMFSEEEKQIVTSDSLTLVYWLEEYPVVDHPKVISERFSGYPEYLKREILKEAYHYYYGMNK